MAAATAMAGETVDALVWRVMGSIAGAVERTLALNPQLLSSPVLAEGAEVMLPAAITATPQIIETIRLWD